MGGLAATAATISRVKVASGPPEGDLPIWTVGLTRLVDGPNATNRPDREAVLHGNREGVEALAPHAMEPHGWLWVVRSLPTFAGLEGLDARGVENIHIRRDTAIKLGEPGLTRHGRAGLGD